MAKYSPNCSPFRQGDTVDTVLSYPLNTALSTELSGYAIKNKMALLVCYYKSKIKDSCTEMIKGLF